MFFFTHRHSHQETMSQEEELKEAGMLARKEVALWSTVGGGHKTVPTPPTEARLA